MRLLVTLLALGLPAAVAAQADATRPVVYGAPGDAYPDTLIVAGVIVEASPTGFGCGVLCVGGTVAVRLDAPGAYPGPVVYVVVPCMTGPDAADFVGRRVRLAAVELEEDPEACYYRSVINRLDSGGAPFYGVGEDQWPAFPERE
ncbi:MAG TPA: hypothetical protein VK610_02555 [Rhodothermales bacterium]|nr:hypothetical protein [Rhodothermales bacterium]